MNERQSETGRGNSNFLRKQAYRGGRGFVEMTTSFDTQRNQSTIRTGQVTVTGTRGRTERWVTSETRFTCVNRRIEVEQLRAIQGTKTTNFDTPRYRSTTRASQVTVTDTRGCTERLGNQW